MKHANPLEHIRQYSLDVWAEAYGKQLDYRDLSIRQILRGDSDNPSEQIRRLPMTMIERAATYVHKGTCVSWGTIREQVWDRDKGICQICMSAIDPEDYHCGHIIDRVCGGSDRPENLVVMCAVANTRDKPLTDTLDEYKAWVKEYRSCLDHQSRFINNFLKKHKISAREMLDILRKG